MQNYQSICMSEYSYNQNLLSSNKQSSIYKAINKNNPIHQPYLFKGYPQKYLSDSIKQKKLMNELNNLWKMNGKDHIVQIISQHSRDKKVFIIMEFCQFGTLEQEIKKQGRFSEEKSIAYIQQIINGYKNIFQAQIIHRNLQPQNIFNAGLQLKIGDFSDSITIAEAQFAQKKEEIVGNIHYLSYETLSQYKYSMRSDIYSIGVILFQMVKGKIPYEGSNKAQILLKMKKTDLSLQLSTIRSKKLQQFLKKALNHNQQKRIGIQQLTSYEFDCMPKLNVLKLFTFDDRSDQIIEQSIHFNKKSSFEANLESKSKQKSQTKFPSKFDTSEKKLSQFQLKMSQQDAISQIQKNKQISIFIPSKLDLFYEQPYKDDDQLMYHLQLPQKSTIRKKPSQLLNRRRKSAVNKQQNNNTPQVKVSNTYKDVLRGNDFVSDVKHKNIANKQFSIIPQKESRKQSNEQNKQMHKTKLEQTQKQTKIPEIHILNIKTADTMIPPLQLNLQKIPNPTSQNKPQTKMQSSTQRTHINGAFTLRGRQTIISELSKKNQSKISLIAGWLISQIDMFRFINRLLFKIKKMQNIQLKELSTSMMKLKIKILFDVKKLTFLQNEQKKIFQQSIQYEKILQIISTYQSKQNIQINIFQGFDKLNKIILNKIHLIYKEMLKQNTLRQDLIKLLDYMITFWQLIKILKKNNIEYFHNKSKINEILDTKQSKLTIGYLLQLYQRMKILKLI